MTVLPTLLGLVLEESLARKSEATAIAQVLGESDLMMNAIWAPPMGLQPGHIKTLVDLGTRTKAYMKLNDLMIKCACPFLLLGMIRSIDIFLHFVRRCIQLQTDSSLEHWTRANVKPFPMTGKGKVHAAFVVCACV